jgi:hypothetical protein
VDTLASETRKPSAQKLTEDDTIAIAAYVASVDP